MKVVYFTESLLPHVDGVSRTLAQLFAFLERQGVEFRIYAPYSPGREISWRDRVHRIPYVPFPLHLDYRLGVPFGRRVSRELREWAPDLVHLVSPTPVNARAKKWAQRQRLPVVSSFHTHFVSYFRYYRLTPLESFGWWLMRRFYAGCQKVYVPTQRIIRELAQHGIRNTELWSRGIDLARFSPEHRAAEIRTAAGVDEDTPIVLMVSRLVKEKDMADLVEMDRVLRRREDRYRLVLVGDGPMRAELQEALPDAYFAGYQTGPELARWYASSDVFVFPSTTETFGNVVLEAQASGLPTVVVDRGGPPDLVEPGETGYVARANDPEDLATQVERLLRDPQGRARMGAQAREAARQRDWSAINGRLLESYRSVIESYRHSPGR